MAPTATRYPQIENSKQQTANKYRLISPALHHDIVLDHFLAGHCVDTIKGGDLQGEEVEINTCFRQHFPKVKSTAGRVPGHLEIAISGQANFAAPE